jgi:lipoprotein-anchoring transpeptidase ErfK/SrfK
MRVSKSISVSSSIKLLDDAIHKTRKKIAKYSDHKRLGYWQSKLDDLVRERETARQCRTDQIDYVKPIKQVVAKPVKPKKVKKTIEQIKARKLEYSLKRYYTDPAMRESIHNNSKRHREQLTDGYIRTVISKTSSMKPKDVPESLIELVRKKLIIKRLLRK